MCLYDIISQTQTQTCSLPCWLCSKKRLKYFLQYYLRDTWSVILYSYFNPTINFFCTHPNSRFMLIVWVFEPPFGGQGGRIKCIVDQVEDHSAYFLRHNIYLTNIVIKFSFNICIKRFVFGSQTMISQS